MGSSQNRCHAGTGNNLLHRVDAGRQPSERTVETGGQCRHPSRDFKGIFSHAGHALGIWIPHRRCGRL